MSVEIRKCLYADVAGDAAFAALFAAYADESRIVGLPFPNPDTECYLGMEKLGMQHTFGAYANGALIGFANIHVVTVPHYSKRLATVESWFVLREHRSTGAGFALKNAIEQAAVDAGAVGLLVSAPVEGPLAAVMAAQSSYRETNRVFFKAFK